jgi:hypothetical protein
LLGRVRVKVRCSSWQEREPWGIDECDAVIRVDAQQSKGQAPLCPQQGAKDDLLAAIAQRQARRPASRSSGHSPTVHRLPFGTLPTMGHQVCRSHARLELIPAGLAANGDGVLGQRARFGGGQTVRFGSLALGLSEPISRGRTDGQQPCFGRLIQAQFPLAFQHADQLRQLGPQAFAAQAIGDPPTETQGLLHRKRRAPGTLVALARRSLAAGVMEQREAHTCDASRYSPRTPAECGSAGLFAPVGSAERRP